MSQTLTVNDTEYLPAAEVGKHFGYTRDYILMLSRDGKIEARKVGNKWYVNLKSAEKFFASASKEREKRKVAIRNERKEELRTHTIKRRGYRHGVIAEVVAVLFLAMSVGATGYLGVTVANDTQIAAVSGSFFESFARAFYEFIAPEDRVVSVTVSDPVVSEVHAVAATESIGTTTYTSLIIAPDTVFTTTTVDSIRDSFSDEVSVAIDPEHPDTGIIVPQFKNHEGEAYRFLMVPVTQSGSQ